MKRFTFSFHEHGTYYFEVYGDIDLGDTDKIVNKEIAFEAIYGDHDDAEWSENDIASFSSTHVEPRLIMNLMNDWRSFFINELSCRAGPIIGEIAIDLDP
jgi:hypothetical protein